ncbi:exodeoxyribonuclease V subunit gamma [soil metagenome]
MTFTILRSHVIERLFDGLAETLDAAHGDVLDLAADVVIVPSLGMGRWLRERLAHRNGVAMQIDTPYLARYVLELAMRAMPGLPTQSPFEPATLAWRLFRLFDQIDAADKELAPLLAFLARTRRDHDADARMQLAERLARQFDRMTAYRSEWLASWGSGKAVLDAGVRETEHWQARLYRLVLADLNPDRSRSVVERSAQHPVDLFAQRLRDGDMFTKQDLGLPDRIDVFAVPAVPPLYWRALQAIGLHVPVTFRQLFPTPHYIADLTQPRGKALARIDNPAAAELLDIGHPLLALWGRQAADLQIQSEQYADPTLLEDFDVDEPASLLAALQASLVECEPPAAGAWADRVGDRSIAVMAAASLERQLEVVHDELLRRFDADATLRPADIAVLLPDIDAAAPAIEAVFGGVPRERAIDWRITGRRETHHRDGLAAALLMLIDLVDSRAPFSQVAALLRHPACRRRFDIDAATGAELVERLHEAGARWGWDSAHRQTFGLVMEPHHSWLDAIDRVVLGYAMGAPDDPTELDGLSGSLLETGSATLAALATIQSWRTDWERPRSVRDWGRTFERAFESMFTPDVLEADEAARIRAACAQLAIDSAAARSDTLVIERRLARRQLEAALEGRAPGAMPTGAVTFAGIAQMRALPFRTLVLVGMDDHAWPRRRAGDEFNLMELRRLSGDPSSRSEERAALLDAVMSAREALLVTYTGRDPRDGSKRSPALVVEELLDVLRTGCGAEAVDTTLLREAALHGFSPAAFDAASPSYAKEWEGAARTLAGATARVRPAPFLVMGDGDPARWRERMPRRLSIDDLVSFLANPPGFYMRRGLRYSDFNQREQTLDEEPLDAPTRKQMAVLVSRIGEARWQDIDEGRIREAERLELPHGLAGRFVFEQAWEASSEWLELMAQSADAAGPVAAPLMVDIELQTELGSVLVTGQIPRRERGLLLVHRRELNARAQAIGYVNWLVNAAAVQLAGSGRPEHAAIVICGDRRRMFVDRAEWTGDAVDTLKSLVLDAAVGAVTPVALSADAAWKYVNKPDAAAWRNTWQEDFDKPYRHLARLFPEGRTVLPSSIGVAGLLSFEQWAARLLATANQISTTHKTYVASRLKKWAQPVTAKKPKASR